ncbi:MAG: amidohydrolase family protein [Clostridiaceae bacterium]|jgi:predicted TIM-barrel fold metal-dependent hydrolase|nr:amidohydrolase family protein [Clostridiaceae bacterium]
MIIDIHTHVFPDELAQKAKDTLLKNINYRYEPVTNLTKDSLIEKMNLWGIDISVVHPVITKKTQLKNTNLWAQSISDDRIISFGGIYPHTEDYKKDIDFVCSLGLTGLKFHAEYQNFEIDSAEMLRIYDYAFTKGLIIMHHAGADHGMPPPYKSNPKKIAYVADQLRGGIMIAAHLGSHNMWDDVERYLMGKNVYLDTSMGFEYYSEEQFLRIVKAHGADKILFGSDSPWSNAKNEIDTISRLPIDQETKDMILGNNAKRILKINI